MIEHNAGYTTKRDALVHVCTEALEAIRPGLKWDIHYQAATDLAAGSRERKRVMGDPTYYLLVLPESNRVPDELGAEDSMRRAFKSIHSFAVKLWLAYEDADEYASSSQAAWDALIEGNDEAPGLLYQLRQTGQIGYQPLGENGDPAGNPKAVSVGFPEEVFTGITDLDRSGHTKEHYLEFVIDVLGFEG